MHTTRSHGRRRHSCEIRDRRSRSDTSNSITARYIRARLRTVARFLRFELVFFYFFFMLPRFHDGARLRPQGPSAIRSRIPRETQSTGVAAFVSLAATDAHRRGRSKGRPLCNSAQSSSQRKSERYIYTRYVKTARTRDTK